ncbi:MAG TPA: ABC transporter permease [Candidatus Methylomirabilis sp.]|nr:ABC transporter permease [Candidatus Methylomirabilis sp.]
MSGLARQHTGLVPSLRRIGALVLRNMYLLRSSGPRILELMYWPTVQMVLWGFITVFLVNHSSWVAQASGVLLSGVLLWDVLFRGQLGVSLVFMEEMWSRNLGHLFVSPLRPFELGCALLTMSLIRTLFGVGGAALIAIPLFHFSIFSLGLPLIAFFVNLIVMGWAIGLLVSGIVLRYGLGAESMAWIAIFAVQPISGVYYPISTLPTWLQYVAAVLPSSHVFEGMRAVLFDHVFRVDLLLHAVALNVLYLVAGFLSFLAFFKIARVRGQLLHVGE